MLFSLIALPLAVFCSSNKPNGLIRPSHKSAVAQALTDRWLDSIRHYDPPSRVEAEKQIKEAGLVLFYSDLWTLDQIESLVNDLHMRIGDPENTFVEEYDPLVILAVLESTLRRKIGSAQHAHVMRLLDLTRQVLKSRFATFASNGLFREVMIGQESCENYANLMTRYLGEDGIFFTHLALGGGKPDAKCLHHYRIGIAELAGIRLSLAIARSREPQYEELYKQLEERIASVEGDVIRRLDNLREFPASNELLLYPVGGATAASQTDLVEKFKRLSTAETATPTVQTEKPTDEMIAQFERLLTGAAAEVATPVKSESPKAEQKSDTPKSAGKAKKGKESAPKDATAAAAAKEAAAKEAAQEAAAQAVAAQQAARVAAEAEAAAKKRDAQVKAEVKIQKGISSKLDQNSAMESLPSSQLISIKEEIDAFIPLLTSHVDTTERAALLERVQTDQARVTRALSAAMAAEEKIREEGLVQKGISDRLSEYEGKESLPIEKLTPVKEEIDYFAALVSSQIATPTRADLLKRILAAQASFTQALTTAVAAEEARKAAEPKLSKKEKAALKKQQEREKERIEKERLDAEKAKAEKPAAEKPKAEKAAGKKADKKKPVVDEDEAFLQEAMQTAAAEAAKAPKESPKAKKSPTAASAASKSAERSRTPESKVASDDSCDYSIATVDTQLRKLIPVLSVAEYSVEKQQAIGCLAVMLAHVSRYNAESAEPCSAVGGSCKAVQAAYELSKDPEFKATYKAAVTQQRQELKLAGPPESQGAAGSLHDYLSRFLQWDIGVLAKAYRDLLLGAAVLKISAEENLNMFEDPTDVADIDRWQETFFHSPQGISEHFGGEEL